MKKNKNVKIVLVFPSEEKREMLVSRDLRAGHLQIICRQKNIIDKNKAVFIFHEPTNLIFSNSSVGEFFDAHATENEPLVLTVKYENTFG